MQFPPGRGTAAVDQSGVVGVDHRLDAVAQRQLVEDVVHVGLDGALAEEQLGTDLGVRPAAGQLAEHVDFAGGEPGQVGGRRRVGAGGGELLDQAAGDGGGQQGVALRRDPHGPYEVLGRDVLEEEAAGAGGQGVEDVFVQVVGGQDDDPGRRGGAARAGEASGGLDAVHGRHADV